MQLERILASHAFAGSQRSQSFLRYVVKRSFGASDDASEETLKEYTIAVEVFERDASYDSSIDATVRVEAGRLRNRLRDYYADEGKLDRLIIEMPKGGYRATVRERPPTDLPMAAVEVPNASDQVVPDPQAGSQETRLETRQEPRGYRWWVATAALLVIALIASALLQRERLPRSPSASGPIRMAILPFRNETGIAADGYLAEGLTENLIRQCSELSPLRVMTRSAVENVDRNSAARQLGVTVILNGALRKDSDGRLLVDGELSNAVDGSVIRSRQYTAEQGDLQPVQADIVQDVIDGLGIALNTRQSSHTQRPATSSPAAFQDFLRGEAAHLAASPESTHLAIESYGEAVRKDPMFALAWAGLADAHAYLGIYFEPPTQHMPLARKAAERAVSIDRSLPSAHGVLGLIHLFYDWDYAGAQKELTAENPREFAITRLGCTSHLLERSGHIRQAKQSLDEMLEFDPRSAMLISELGCVQYYDGKYEEAIRDYRRSLAADPRAPLAYWGLGKSLAREGRYTEALEVLRRFKTVNGFEPPIITAEIGYTLGASGDKKDALEVAHSLELASKTTWVDPYFQASIYLSVKDESHTYAWLDKAYLARSPFLISMTTEPKWGRSQEDPRFQALLHRMLSSHDIASAQNTESPGKVR